MEAKQRAMLEVFGEALLTDPKNEHLKEAFDRVRHMLQRDDMGWQLFQGGGGDRFTQQYGLTLEDLRQWNKKIQESVVAAPWVGAGFRRRADYIWQNGIRYGNIPGADGQDTGQGQKNIQKLIDKDGNQFHFFSDSARRAREKGLYSAGINFWVGNDRTKNIEAIPLWQITDEMLEPNGLGYAWAYLREWTEYNLTTGESTKHKRWIFTDRFKEHRVTAIKRKDDPEAILVDQDHVIFDQIANRSMGLVYGSPDALAAWIWNDIAKDATMDGRAMQEALTTFALTAKNPSRDASQDAAIKLANTDGAGNIAVTGATDLVPLASAGKGYDFGSIRFLVAIVAAALDISVIHLTANPGDAGSSYGSAQTLDLPTRLAMEARRAEHVELDKRVLKWMGVKKPDVNFVPYTGGEEVYRAIQALTMELNNGSLTLQEYRDQLDDLMGRPNGEVADYDKIHPVQLAKAIAKAQPKPAPAPSGTGGSSAPQTASPGQGRSTGTGDDSEGGNDIRRD